MCFLFFCFAEGVLIVKLWLSNKQLNRVKLLWNTEMIKENSQFQNWKVVAIELCYV